MGDRSSKWKDCRLGEAGRWLSGGTPSTSEPSYWSGDIPWISASSLTGFHVTDSHRRLTAKGAASGTRLVEPGTLLFVVRGMSLKSEFRLGITRRRVAFGQDCKAVIARPGIDPLFLAYAVKARASDILAMVDEAGHGTGRLVTDRLANLRLLVPPLNEQRTIANVLGALDDKIENNQRIADTAPQLAAALLQQAAEGADRVRLGDVAEVRKGLSYKGSGLADDGMPMVNLANAATFGGFKRRGFKRYTGDHKPRHVAQGGDLLVANTDLTWKLEALGWPMLLPEDVPEALFSQDISILDFAEKWRHLRLPVWAHLFTRAARLRAEGMAYGTTVARFPPDALTGMDVPVLDAAARVLDDAEALLRRAWAAERESDALARLRDALLPPLMSGELRVGEAEQLATETT